MPTWVALLCVILCICLAACCKAFADEDDNTSPGSPTWIQSSAAPVDFDWIMLSSGEWQGEFLLPVGENRYYFLENGWRRAIDPMAPMIERETGIRYVSVLEVPGK